MKDNRHSILESHIGYIISMFEENYYRAKKNAELNVTFEGNEELNGRKTLCFKAIFPEDKEYYGHIITINLDVELFLPIKIATYGWDMELLEMYHYTDLEINVGLSDFDFDIDNPAYDF